MTKAFVSAFHMVFVTYVYRIVCTCIVENKYFFILLLGQYKRLNERFRRWETGGTAILIVRC